MRAVPGCCHVFSQACVKQAILLLPEATFQSKSTGRRNLRTTISLETSQQMQGQARCYNKLNILGVDLQVLPTSILPLAGGLA